LQQGTSSAFRTEIVPDGTKDMEQKMSTLYISTSMDNKDVEGISEENFFL